MSTFENGWICKECWSANREFDGRCYRCHADRPADPVITTSTGEVSKTATEQPIAVNSSPASPAEPKRVTRLVSRDTGPPAASHCLRCGHQVKDRASYCTQCGAAVEDLLTAPAPSAKPATQTAVAARRRVAWSAAVRDLAWGFVRRLQAPAQHGLHAGVATFGRMRARLADVPRAAVPTAILILSLVLFALSARVVATATQGQVLALLAGAALLSGLAATTATLLAVGRHPAVVSPAHRLRILAELEATNVITSAEHAAHRNAILAELSGATAVRDQLHQQESSQDPHRTSAGASIRPTPAH